MAEAADKAVVLAPGPHPAALDPGVLRGQCRAERTRGSGPGGQHRNKMETAIRLHHEPTGLVGAASERRSRAENEAVALRRLRVALAVGVRVAREPGAAPSALWASRRQGNKLVISPGHADFPALLAEALDAIGAHGQDVSAAAAGLGVSASQVLRLLRHEPGALGRVNAARAARGLRPLR